MNNSYKIETFQADKEGLTLEDIEFICDLINNVYLSSESDFWPSDGTYSRTSVKELNNFIKNKQLIIATKKDEIVGAVHVYPIQNSLCGFGMLVSSPSQREVGVGSALMHHVEKWAANNNYKTIQLELLRPVNYLHPEKEFLKEWYIKLGYQKVSSNSYKSLYPEQAQLLIIPCTFDIYQKNLEKY